MTAALHSSIAAPQINAIRLAFHHLHGHPAMTTNNELAEAAARNARHVETQIRYLASGHWRMPLVRDYKSFWAHAKEISAAFKTLKPLWRADRERLWEEFGVLCDEATAKQQADWDKRSLHSNQYREWILREARSAKPFGIPNPTAQELKDLGRVLARSSALLSAHKEEMVGEHKQECFALIQEVRQLHDVYWAGIKKAGAQHQGDRRLRAKANLEKNNERLRKASGALTHMRDHADDLREKISSARSDEFRSRACGWLSEAEDKIRDIERSIDEIEGWIQEDEARL